MKNISEKIGLGLIAIYILICVVDMIPKEERPVDPEIGRAMVIEQLNNTHRESVQKELRQ